MASKTIGGFPSGATVAAYLRSSLLPSSSLSPPPPSGTAAETETAGSDGRVTFSTLVDETDYVASDGSRVVSFTTDETQASTGSGGPNVKAVVEHGADPTVARPAGFGSVEWIGTVQPDNATTDDTWVNPNDSTQADLAAHAALTTGVHGFSDTTKVKAVVNHGASAGVTRPTGFASVEWIGTVSPSNALSGDTWINPNETAAAQGTAGGALSGSYPNPGLADGGVLVRHLARLAKSKGGFLPTGAKAQTIPGRESGTLTNGAFASGTVRVAPIVLAGGETYSSISLMAGTTGPAGLTNLWFGLVDVATRNILATTVDDVVVNANTSWTANTVKTIGLATAVGGATPGGSFAPANGIEAWVIACVAGTTPGTFCGIAYGANAPPSVAPVMCGVADTGKTGPFSGQIIAPSFNINSFWAYVS